MVNIYFIEEKTLEQLDKFIRKRKLILDSVEVLKKSEVEKEIESFEKKSLITAGGIETGFYLDKEDWQDFKTKLLKGEG